MAIHVTPAAKHIIITSSLPPEKVYWRRDNEDYLEQLFRRIKIIEVVAEVHGG